VGTSGSPPARIPRLLLPSRGARKACPSASRKPLSYKGVDRVFPVARKEILLRREGTAFNASTNTARRAP
jgi:hypothetical protein